MKAKVWLSDGGHLGFDDLCDDSALSLKSELNDGGPDFLTFDMDGATVVVNRAHIVRIDFETGQP